MAGASESLSEARCFCRVDRQYAMLGIGLSLPAECWPDAVVRAFRPRMVRTQCGIVARRRVVGLSAPGKYNP